MAQQYHLELHEFKIQYIVNTQHRNDNQNKSQWTIIEDDEFACFKRVVELVYIHGFDVNSVCWSLHFDDGLVIYLGEAAANAPNSREKLFIAKFVCDNNETWHGYPANPAIHTQDIPSSDLLDYWLSQGYLTRAKIRKIARGQKCTL